MDVTICFKVGDGWMGFGFYIICSHWALQVEMPFQGPPGLVCSTWPISWLLMTRRREEPGHQEQACPSLHYVGIFIQCVLWLEIYLFYLFYIFEKLRSCGDSSNLSSCKKNIHLFALYGEQHGYWRSDDWRTQDISNYLVKLFMEDKDRFIIYGQYRCRWPCGARSHGSISHCVYLP